MNGVREVRQHSFLWGFLSNRHDTTLRSQHIFVPRFNKVAYVHRDSPYTCSESVGSRRTSCSIAFLPDRCYLEGSNKWMSEGPVAGCRMDAATSGPIRSPKHNTIQLVKSRWQRFIKFNHINIFRAPFVPFSNSTVEAGSKTWWFYAEWSQCCFLFYLMTISQLHKLRSVKRDDDCQWQLGRHAVEWCSHTVLQTWSICIEAGT
jgi:hypothetical protein